MDQPSLLPDDQADPLAPICAACHRPATFIGTDPGIDNYRCETRDCPAGKIPVLHDGVSSKPPRPGANRFTCECDDSETSAPRFPLFGVLPSHPANSARSRKSDPDRFSGGLTKAGDNGQIEIRRARRVKKGRIGHHPSSGRKTAFSWKDSHASTTS